MIRKPLLLSAAATLTAAGTMLGLGLSPVLQSSPAAAAAAPVAKTTSGPCGTLPLSSTNYTHVIWVWMENHSYNTIIGSSSAPYMNSLAQECGLATNYHNIGHPSLPNYVGATAGLGLRNLKQFKNDCDPSSHCSTSMPSIFGQGESWKAYEESMPSNCFPTNSGEYAVRHNPPPYFNTLSGCATFDVPYSQLGTDLADNTLPAFSFVTPNLIDDMHDGTIQQGDTWLADNLPAIFSSSEYQSGSTVVFVTWDEGEGGTSKDCAQNTTDVGCQVATLVVSPSTVPGTTSGLLFNHYSMLKTTEDLLRLPELGLAMSNASMSSPFNL